MDRVRIDSPVSATLVSWGNAWLTGHAGLDDAVDRLERTDGPQVVVSAATGESTLRVFLLDRKREGLDALRLALPAPGDPLGLTGPPAFNGVAVDARQAVIAVLPGRCLGLVPTADRRGSSYSGVRWTVHEASTTPPDLPSLPEAEQALTTAMRAATEALLAIEGPAQGFPASVHEVTESTLAPGYAGRAHRVGALVARLTLALRLAEERGLTAGQITTRAEALRDLDRAVRRARIAAHHAIIRA